MIVDVTRDDETGATYYRLSRSPVARTANPSDLVMVDLDADGDVIGVEFAFAPETAHPDELAALYHAFPALPPLTTRVGIEVGPVSSPSRETRTWKFWQEPVDQPFRSAWSASESSFAPTSRASSGGSRNV
jgi:uncharacterized protein YuzE